MFCLCAFVSSIEVIFFRGYQHTRVGRASVCQDSVSDVTLVMVGSPGTVAEDLSQEESKLCRLCASNTQLPP